MAQTTLQPRPARTGRRLAVTGAGITVAVTVVAASIAAVDAAAERPWTSFFLTMTVTALILGVLPGLRGWKRLPWGGVAALVVIAAGFVMAAPAVLSIGCIAFAIGVAVHERRSRRQTPTRL